jgi:hypothetical protein
VDAAGRLLVIEAKPAGSSAGITWGPAQVGYYARLFSLWVDADEQAAITTVDQMLGQRVQLGLAAPGLPGLRCGWCQSLQLVRVSAAQRR